MHVHELARDDGDWEILADDSDGDRIPNLSQLPQEEWLEALRPLCRNDRIRAQNTLPLARIPEAMIVLSELASQEYAARARARMAGPARLPAGDPPPPGARRQVNFRLGTGEHARLVEASRLYGMSPTVLARLLTIRGVDRALREAQREG